MTRSRGVRKRLHREMPELEDEFWRGHRFTAVAVFLDRLTAEPNWREHLISVASDLVAFATDKDAPPPHLPLGHE
jgi:hypothetical protein